MKIHHFEEHSPCLGGSSGDFPHMGGGCHFGGVVGGGGNLETMNTSNQLDETNRMIPNRFNFNTLSISAPLPESTNLVCTTYINFFDIKYSK